MVLRHIPSAAEQDADRVRAVTLTDALSGDQLVVHAAYVLDATELGDLLDLAGVEHVVGAESQAQTGEPHALAGAADPLTSKPSPGVFALDYLPDADHTIARPADHDFWRAYQADFWPGRNWAEIDLYSETLQRRERAIFNGPPEREHAEDFWHYRRIFYRQHYPPGLYPSDITLINWPQNDYWLGPW